MFSSKSIRGALKAVMWLGRRQVIAIREELRHASVKGGLNLAQTYISMRRRPTYVHSKPTMVQIEPTLSCNLRCKMCVRTYWRKKTGDLTFGDFKKIVDQFPYLRQLNLTGVGESLLNRDFLRMVEYAKSKRVHVKLFDNATLITREVAEKMVSLGMDEIFISLDGGTPETFERIRVGANFEEVVENTRTLMRIKREKRRRTPEVVIITTAMKESFREVPKLVELAHSLGIGFVVVQGLQLFERGMARKDQLINALEPEDVIEVVDRSKRLGDALGVTVEFAGIRPKPQPCFWPWVGCFVTYDGEVAPCCMINQRTDREDVLKKIGFGNMLEEGFDDIWNNERARDFRFRLSSGDLPIICRNCPVLEGRVVSF